MTFAASAARSAAKLLGLLVAVRAAWAALRFRLPGESAWSALADRLERDGGRLALLAILGGALLEAVRRLRGSAPPPRRSRLPFLLVAGFLLAFPARRWVLERAGAGPAFADATDRAGLRAPRDLVEDAFDAAAADVDGDGDADVLANLHNLRDFALLRYDGAGGFRDVAEEAGLLGAPPLRAILGRPAAPPPEDGFDLFHDPPGGPSALGAWRVRWRASARGRRFEGTVETNVPILRASASGGRCTVAPDARSLRFESEEPGPSGSLEFETGFLEGRYRFDLRVDGRGDPSRLRVGPGARAAEAMPLEIALGDPHGIAFGDADGDGDADLFVTHGAMRGELAPPAAPKADAFFRNEGGRFRESAAAAGIENPYGRGRSAAWLDLDRDGFLDLFVGNLRQPALFFRGSKEGRFVEEGASRGLALEGASAFRWFDADEDGDLDLLALSPLALHRNEGGRFAEDPGAMGLPRGAFGGPAASGLFPDISASFADVDGDGDQDLYLAGPGAAGSGIYLREGAAFRAAAEGSGLPRGARHVAFADADDDGRVDAYVVQRTGPARLLRNQGGGRFAEATRAFGLALDGSVGRTALWLEADGSPGIDLLALARVARRPWDAFFEPLGPHRLFRNGARAGNRAIEVLLRSRSGGLSGLGARVRVATEEAEQVQVAGDRWFTPYGQSLLPLHFGIGRSSGAEAVEVTWPSGGRSLRLNVRASERIEIEEP